MVQVRIEMHNCTIVSSWYPESSYVSHSIGVLISRYVAVCTAGRVHTAGGALITNTIHTAWRVYSI